MLLGVGKQNQIQAEIMKDLFEQPKKALEERKSKLVVRGYQMWISQYAQTMRLLPKEFFTFEDFARMTVVETDNQKTTWNAYKDVNANEGFVSMVDNSRYGRSAKEFDMPEELADDVQEVVTKLAELAEEEKKMETYLSESLKVWNTTHKLRQNWDTMFHKYIPPEPPRAPRTKKATPEDVSTSIDVNDIKKRMTLNILEN